MPDKPPTNELLQREISATPDEFRRGLLLAFPGQVEATEHTCLVTTATTAMEIRLNAGSPRIIAKLRLPTLQISIRFTAGDTAARQEMLAHMDRAMHRGGG